ncbi:MAG: RNB domain-containing ribonuclease [Myxococcales bacterium]|nr:RNB domain-containing ribonuclease [Myxococcales bacterium]
MLLAALAVGANPFFPARVRREVAAIDLDRSLAERALVDLTSLPFVTIDAATSRDLDQALHVEVGGGPGVAYVVRYALADAAHFVPKDSALFEEALTRGASVYLPGFSVPMLPRELSEGVVSLNPDGPRRALVFEVRVDRDGKILSTDVRRAKVRSRAKLAFPDVQALYDTGGGALSRVEFSASLEALRGVGEVLIREAASRDVARYRRGETELQLTGPDGAELTLVDSPRAGRDVQRAAVAPRQPRGRPHAPREPGAARAAHLPCAPVAPRGAPREPPRAARDRPPRARPRAALPLRPGRAPARGVPRRAPHRGARGPRRRRGAPAGHRGERAVVVLVRRRRAPRRGRGGVRALLGAHARGGGHLRAPRDGRAARGRGRRRRPAARARGHRREPLEGHAAQGQRSRGQALLRRAVRARCGAPARGASAPSRDDHGLHELEGPRLARRAAARREALRARRGPRARRRVARRRRRRRLPA